MLSSLKCVLIAAAVAGQSNQSMESFTPVCSDFISRDKILFSRTEFFTPQNLDHYQTLYDCSKIESKKGLFADKTALNDLDSASELVAYFEQFDSKKKVGIMGGSDLDRNTQGFTDVALIAQRLSNDGYIIITGGGPGAMEAAHLGAWFSGRSVEELYDAITILSTVPKYVKDEWINTAYAVQKKYPRVTEGADVAIATLVYGQRPPTPFSSYVARFFSESLREESILLSSTGAVVFTPGGPGTDEEVYASFKHKAYRGPTYSQRPLVLFNSQHWSAKLMPQMLSKGFTADTVEEVMSLIENQGSARSKLEL